MSQFELLCVLLQASLCVSFHIPDLSVSSDVALEGNVINSTLKQNWNQSLNVGSISIAATLIILILCLLMYLRLQNQLVQQQRCLNNLKDEFQQFKVQKDQRAKTRCQSMF